MSKKAGYVKLFEVRKTPVFVHWSLPAVGALISLFCASAPNQLIYYYIAFVLLVIVHESGHFLAATALRLKVFAVEISGFGGICRTARPRRVLHSVFLYSAGLLAQALSFLVAVAYITAYGCPRSAIWIAILMTFTFVNAVLFVINLIPQRASRSGLANDGLVLWQLFLHVFRGHRHPHPPLVAPPADQVPVFPPETRLLQKPGFRPPGFVHGIEILNDSTTPMNFVVSTLMTHLQITENEAIVNMLDIHNTGGILVPFRSAQDAQRVADTISSDARAAGYSFVCRYAGTQ